MKYYELMIQYALHESAYLNVAKYYYKIWETPSIQEDEDGKSRRVITSRLQISALLRESIIRLWSTSFITLSLPPMRTSSLTCCIALLKTQHWQNLRHICEWTLVKVIGQMAEE
jgi:hypothetical protein